MNITHNCREWLDDAGECTICEVADKSAEVSKTCDTCKWWKESEDGFYGSEGNPIETFQCDSPKLLKFVKPERDGASLMDGSYYRATLHTGPKFGCVHWETKA